MSGAGMLKQLGLAAAASSGPAAKRMMRRVAIAAVVCGFALALIFLGAGFAAFGLFLALATSLGPAWAALLVGVLALLVAVVLIWTVAPGLRPRLRSRSRHAPANTTAPGLALLAISGFLSGVTSGRGSDRSPPRR